MNDRKWNTKSHTHTHACSHDWSTFIYKLTRFILLFGVIVEVFLRIGRTLFYHHYHHTSPQKYDAKSPNGITIPFSQLLYGTWAWTSIRREKFFSLFQHHFMEVNYRKGNWTTIFAVARKGDKKVQQAIMYQNHSTSRSVVRQNIDLTSKHELFKDHCESLIISIEDHCYLLVSHIRMNS